MLSLKLQIKFDPEGRIGPGKVALLEAIQLTGSISAAARKMKMSYRRAWQLVDELNKTVGRPVVDCIAGGVSGGGARLTEAGAELVKRYRAIEIDVIEVAAMHLETLHANIRQGREAQEMKGKGPSSSVRRRRTSVAASGG